MEIASSFYFFIAIRNEKNEEATNKAIIYSGESHIANLKANFDFNLENGFLTGNVMKTTLKRIEANHQTWKAAQKLSYKILIKF